jgi:hypothetical protein
MKVIEFEGNERDCLFTYHRVREGPNYFVGYYKNSSQLFYDPKNAWRMMGVAKFTDMGKALKAWCVEMDATYGAEVKEGYADGSFAGDNKTIV